MKRTVQKLLRPVGLRVVKETTLVGLEQGQRSLSAKVSKLSKELSEAKIARKEKHVALKEIEASLAACRERRSTLQKDLNDIQKQLRRTERDNERKEESLSRRVAFLEISLRRALKVEIEELFAKTSTYGGDNQR